MKVLLLTNEYPPYVYGGAGVHVEYLSRELANLMPVDVRCFGDQDKQLNNLSVKGADVNIDAYNCPKNLKAIFGASQRCLDFMTCGLDADVVHCHTWYTHLAGIFAKLNYGIPLVITVHSLEPLRPWKREQLGGGYDFSLWVEKTAIEMADAIIAVSEGTRNDILAHFNVNPNKIKIIYNGIDTQQYSPRTSTKALEKYGIDPKKPYLLFVGRITRQKGILYLVQAIKYMNKDFQIVLCAGAPDTAEIALEMKTVVEEVKKEREEIIWIEEMVDKVSLIEIYSHASAFCCPSIYEPFGIINLEAMSCKTPVIASDVGGIPEVVVHGQTGLLVPLAQIKESPFTPISPETYARDLADAVNRVMSDKDLQRRFAQAGRERAMSHFSWTSIAHQTKELYSNLIKR